MVMSKPAISRAFSTKPSLTLWSVSAIGIGSMVGTGIFALLGPMALVAGDGLPLSFFLAGLVTMLAGYSYAKLAARYPDSGGILVYYAEAFRSPVVSGGLSLVYLMTITFSVCMISKTFGAYAAGLIPGVSENPWVIGAFSSLAVIATTGLNIVGSKTVGRAETLIVIAKLGVLAALILAAVPILNPTQIAQEHHTEILGPLSNMGLAFLSFAGFGIVTNAAGDVANPRRTIPRAIYLSIGIVVLLYIALALVVLNTLSHAEIVRHADTAVAQAGRELLGSVGFNIVSVVVLLAALSTINANLFSALRISRAMADNGQLPPLFNTPVGPEGTGGLLATMAVILVMTNLFDLMSIASVVGTSFLACDLAVFIANWKLRRRTRSSGPLIAIGFLSMLTVFITFEIGLWRSHPQALALSIIFLILGPALEWTIALGSRRGRQRESA